MKPVVLTDVLAVGEFPTSDQVAILAKAGFKSILNNQPDGEVARFDTDAQVSVEAKRHGLVHAYAPLSSRTPPPDELERYATALAALPAPIYAFCYSGSRAAAACALLLTSTTDVGAILRQFEEAGFDLSGLTPWLEEARARYAPPAEKAAAVDGLTPAVVIEAEPAQPAKARGIGAGAMNGASVHHEGVVPALQAPVVILSTRTEAGLPPMIVVEPRAAGYGGFAR